jgi:hypothetical protein
VIRFCCTKCGRESLLVDAFAGLPLLCKGCGDRVIVPDPSESLPDPPAPRPPKPAVHRAPHPPVSLPDPPLPAPADEAPTEGEATRNEWIARLGDAGGFLLMLVVGALVGAMVAGKSSLRILEDAPASPKFPPTDLLLWVASVAVFGLFYVWLGTRGWSLGNWLRRR